MSTSSSRCLVPANGVELHVHALGTGAPEGLTHADALRSALACSPEQPVLVVLHGGPGGDHRPLVPPLLPLVEDGLVVLLVDLRGHGLSSRPEPAECTLAHMADDLTALEATLGLSAERCSVLGVSFGGSVALTFAQRTGSNGCARLLLSSAVTNFRADDDWAEWIAAHGSREQARAAATIASGSVPTLDALQDAQRLIRSLYYYDPAHIPPPSTLTACADEDVRPSSLELVNWWYREGRRAYCADAFLADLRVPTLVMAGCADPLGTPAQARRLAESIPGAQLALFARSGHLPQFEEPEAYRAAIRSFVCDGAHQ